MIAITPFLAEYEVTTHKTGGKLSKSWRGCKVMGIIKSAGHDPEYLIEVYHTGTSSLETVREIKRSERGNPL